jgi:hypothetical protein
MRLSGERLLATLALGLATAVAATAGGCGGSSGNPPRGEHRAVLGGGNPGSGGGRPGSGGAGTAALKAVQGAATATLSGSAQVEYVLHGAKAFGASAAPVMGSGEFDFQAGVGAEKIDLGETGKQEPGNEAAVFLPSKVYLQPKSFGAAVLPKGKEWMSATLAGSESVSTNFPAFVLQAEAVNPQFLLAQLAAGASAATPLGIDLVSERPARVYEVTVDLPRVLSGLRGASAAVFGQAIQSELAAAPYGGAARSSQATIVAWLDGGRVVQLRTAPAGAGAGTVTMTLCCFGSDVAVKAPKPAKVVDITALTPSGERENNGGGDSDGG